MKKLRIFAAIMSVAFATTNFVACKEHREDMNVGAGAQDGEDYINQQDKSHVTETGQRIGGDADSTTIDGERGNRSNY